MTINQIRAILLAELALLVAAAGHRFFSVAAVHDRFFNASLSGIIGPAVIAAAAIALVGAKSYLAERAARRSTRTTQYDW